MKKLKLSELNLGSAEVLTREQLKKVLGGQMAQTTGISCMTNFTDSQGYTHMTMGDCASQDMDTCTKYALDNCRSEAYEAGGSCTFWNCSGY